METGYLNSYIIGNLFVFVFEIEKISDDYRRIITTKYIKKGSNIFDVNLDYMVLSEKSDQWYDRQTKNARRVGNEHSILALYLLHLLKDGKASDT